MSVKMTELGDFIALTLNDLPDNHFEVNWTNQDYEFTRIYQNERMVIDGGNQIERKIMFDNSGHARYRYNYDTDEPSVEDLMSTIKVPWTRLGTYYGWDDLELRRNLSNTKRVVDLLKERRVDGSWALADLIESRSWLTPTNATDELYPYGVPYYINHMTSGSSTDGFVGQTITYQDGTTGTTCANINASTSTKWRNYAALYTDIDNAFIKKVRLAMMYTKFKPPVILNDPSQAERTAQKRFYSDFNTVADLMDLADAKNDNHSGKEVLGGLIVDDGGLVMLNRLPVVPIAQLESVTDPASGTATAPIYCVDFSYFVPFVHEGYWMIESEPMTDRTQHTSYTVFLDGAHQNLCTNRKRVGFVLHKSH